MGKANDGDPVTPSRWLSLGLFVLRHLGDDDDPALWSAALDTILADAEALCRLANRRHLAVFVGRCTRWLRPHQTRWTADGGFAWPTGYLGRPSSRTGLPELDWSVAFALDPERATWRPVAMPASRGALVLRVAVPGRTARHPQAAVHTVWAPGSPVNPRRETVQFYGFRREDRRWVCTAYRGDEGLYEVAADRASCLA